MMTIDSIKAKYDKRIFKDLDRQNFNQILSFLLQQNCNYIEDIITDYLDLFTFEYIEFIDKYNILNEKYKGEFLKLASEDMNLLEEFYNI